MQDAILITGAFWLGVFHVVTGVDHLVAMAPSSITRTKVAIKNGFLWGVGHSSGLILLTIFTLLIKDFTKVDTFSNFAELLVGISLLIIGIFAIKNSFQLSIHSHSHKHKNGVSHHHLHFHSEEQKKHNKHSHALTGMGLLHGIAGGSHFFAVSPVLVLSPPKAIAYLISYLSGSLISMILFSCLISSSILISGKKFIKRLIIFAGGLSFSIGLFLVQKSAGLLLT